MSDPSSTDFAGRMPEIPANWRILLIDAGMKVLAFAGRPGAGESKPQRGLDLADYMAEEGLDLAEVGELLVCLEDMPTDCELRLRLGNPSYSIVARGFREAKGVICVVLRPNADAEAERVLPDAWTWAAWMIHSLGLMDRDPANAPVQILIVDENPEVVIYGRTLSRKLGCRSSGAGSAGAALAEVKARPFDLVIVDSGLSGMGAPTLRALASERSQRDWGRAPMFAMMTPSDSSLSYPESHSLEKPVGLDELREFIALAKEFRQRAMVDASRNPELEILNLDIWEEDKPLLRRLTQALVAQGAELTMQLSENPSYPDRVDFMKDLNSLKNGCDILHAYRLAAACKELLEVSQDPLSRSMLAKLDSLLVEIEGFRLFVAGHGLLRDFD